MLFLLEGCLGDFWSVVCGWQRPVDRASVSCEAEHAGY